MEWKIWGNGLSFLPSLPTFHTFPLSWSHFFIAATWISCHIFLPGIWVFSIYNGIFQIWMRSRKYLCSRPIWEFSDWCVEGCVLRHQEDDLGLLPSIPYRPSSSSRAPFAATWMHCHISPSRSWQISFWNTGSDILRRREYAHSAIGIQRIAGVEGAFFRRQGDDSDFPLAHTSQIALPLSPSHVSVAATNVY